LKNENNERGKKINPNKITEKEKQTVIDYSLRIMEVVTYLKNINPLTLNQKLNHVIFTHIVLMRMLR
jgi:hypothetical protein